MSDTHSHAPISVIIPCYNCQSTISRALRSVLLQTLLPSEIILIDDASDDDTLSLLYTLQELYSSLIKVISLGSNSGPGMARNAGWNASSQNWLAFLDADDAWHPQKLELQFKWITANRNVAICGHASIVAQDWQECKIQSTQAAIQLSFLRMLISNSLPTRSVMIRADLPFRFKDKKYSEDYLLWLQIIKARYPCFVLNYQLAYCFKPEFSHGGFSGNLWEHEKRELSSLIYLYKNGSLSLVVLVITACWSYIKYLRRCLVMKSRQS